MKIRLADYVADFLVSNGITNCFTVTGGGAMHLNDALGHKEGLKCLYNHHEQACAIAAEAYARINNKIAAVCVTTGPGGTNAITGVIGGWLDSVPMLIISGQVRYDTSKRGMGLDIRAGGDQEFDITRAVECMTKYCEMIEDPKRIRYALEKSLYLATHGRPGPCWIDIPVNFQGCFIETDELVGFCPDEEENDIAPKTDLATVDAIIEKIKSAERPVLYAGNGVRLSGGFESFEKVVRRLNIPVVTGWDNIDMMADDDELYVGRGGIMGDRAGNFAAQNADLILAVGNRLSIRQVGYNWKTWAREAFVIMVDVDAEELKKPTLHVEMPVHADAKDFLDTLISRLPEGKLFAENGWQQTCRDWKKNYPVVLPKHYAWEGLTNPYAFVKKLSDRLPEGYTTVVGNGTACVVGSHAYTIKKDQRFIINSAVASMGYDLPAAVGVCAALDKQEIVCLTGDGSIQMNLQELQTVLTNKLPIKIFVINNDGYHSIRQTQTNIFGEHTKVGIGPESGDLSFPSLEKLAWAYGYDYAACNTNAEIDALLDKAFSGDGAFIGEVFVDPAQFFEPKSATKRLPDGTLVSPPLEDLAPFLDREELKSIMKIPMIEE
ncbi:MAG: thiamine pyrophosphate-binding protein [Ruminococcaceae bacterium]|nr:thiamine pyrophosphate-binding protein [Oscillospiraceae bacterium]